LACAWRISDVSRATTALRLSSLAIGPSWPIAAFTKRAMIFPLFAAIPVHARCITGVAQVPEADIGA
jgi:hypothetical protein